MCVESVCLPTWRCPGTFSVLRLVWVVQMLIKGIRSFSPSNQGVIEFYKPLTLIVGHNGAGKTVGVESRSSCSVPESWCFLGTLSLAAACRPSLNA